MQISRQFHGSRLLLVILSSFFLNSSFFMTNPMAAQQTSMYFKVEVSKDVFLESRFLLYLPAGYDSLDRQWPLLLFLHGRGERGEMIDLVKKNGPPKMIEFGHAFPFIVVSPQCPEDQMNWSVEELDMLLDAMVTRYKVDTSQVWVTGLSMGGHGTWELACAYPDRFAAIVPICGWADPKQAALIKDLPAWVFHGAKDEVVPLSASEDMVNALKALGSTVRFTVYPEANHDSWTETYANPELWQWLEAQKQHKVHDGE